MNADRWIAVLSVVCAIVMAGIAWLQYRKKKEKRQIEPDPLRVRKVYAKANEEECKQRYMMAMDALAKAGEENRKEHGRLYDQIDVVERRFEDRLNGSLEKVNETIRKLPGEVLGMLRTTGQLKDHRD